MNLIGEVISNIVNFFTGNSDNNSDSLNTNESSNDSSSTSNENYQTNASVSGCCPVFSTCIRQELGWVISTSIIVAIFAFLGSMSLCVGGTFGAGILACLGPAVETGVMIGGMWFTFAMLMSAYRCYMRS